jgi:putative intracellular protease/amidase
MGATLALERRISPSDGFDLIYVPGGVGAADAARDDTVLRFVRHHHADGRWVAGNCAGVGVLHRAGILDGVEVTPVLARRATDERGPGDHRRRPGQLGRRPAARSLTAAACNHATSSVSPQVTDETDERSTT